MRKIIWFALLIILILPACSSNQDMQRDNERMVSSSSWFVDKLIIVNNKVYVGTEELADNIGEKITSIETFSTKEEEVNYQNFSNYYPAGTNIYLVQGSAAEEKIAVEESSGNYIIAVRSK